MLIKQSQRHVGQRLWSVDWHPKGNLMATVGQSKSVKLWGKNNNEEWILKQTLQTQHTKSLRCIRFNHKGNSFAISSFDSCISIFIMAQQGYQQLGFLEGHQNEVKCVDWNINDKQIASCSRDKNVWIWSFNEANFQYECDFTLMGHTEDVKSVIWLDQGTLASSSYDNTIRIWGQNDDDYEQQQVLTGHSSIVWSLAYDRKKEILYSSGQDKKIIQWRRNPKNSKFQYTFAISQVHLYPIYCCDLLNSSYLFTGSGDNTIAMIGLQQKQQKMLVTDRKQHQGDVNCVRCWGREQVLKLASVGDDEKLIIWNIKI